MKQYTRWYDKDKNLNAFMSFLESLPHEAQTELASDILLNIPNVIDSDYDEFVNIISENKPIGYKRWYDATLILHTAVEALKELSEHQVEMLLHLVSDIILKNSKLVSGENDAH